MNSIPFYNNRVGHPTLFLHHNYILSIRIKLKEESFMKERDVVDFEKLKETNPEMFDENLIRSDRSHFFFFPNIKKKYNYILSI